MKYLSLIAGLAFFASCSNNNSTETKNAGDTKDQAPKIAEVKDMDPVCEMPKDSTWTDYVVKGTDSVWFCSAHCKDVYSANPDKYKETHTH